MKTYAKKDGSDWILNGNKVTRVTQVIISLHLNITLNSFPSSPLQVFITNGWMADLVVVVAVTNREAKSAAHGISLFLVENGMKGFHKGRKLEKIGLKAQVLELNGRSWFYKSTRSCKNILTLFFLLVSKDTAELFFEDVRLPANALLGQLNKGFYYLMNELPQVKGTMGKC